MKIRTADLNGAALDWAVAQCEGLDEREYVEIDNLYGAKWRGPEYSTDWAQGGPIIEREKIEWQWIPAPDKAHQYGARKPSLGGLNRTFCMDGPTVLVAAMRCCVISEFGYEIDIPEELL